MNNKIKGIKKYLSFSIFAVFCIFYIFMTVKNNSIWIKAGEINRSIPKIINDYYKKYGANIRCYFFIPSRYTNAGAELFANELPEVLAPLFAPVSPEAVILLGDIHDTDPAYRGNNFDLRQPDVLGGLGKKAFFFQCNEDKLTFDDLSLQIKSNLLKQFARPHNFTLPRLDLSDYSGSIYLSPPLNIPAYFLGGIEVKMRFKDKGYRDITVLYWYKNDSPEPLARTFYVEMDGRFHIYSIPFTIYKADWTQDVVVVKIELLPPDISPHVDIEYIKFLPYAGLEK